MRFSLVFGCPVENLQRHLSTRRLPGDMMDYIIPEKFARTAWGLVVRAVPAAGKEYRLTEDFGANPRYLRPPRRDAAASSSRDRPFAHSAERTRCFCPTACLARVAKRRGCAFVEIASKAGIDKVLIAVIATRRNRFIMVNGQFAARVRFGEAAIAAAISIKNANGLEFEVGHPAQFPLTERRRVKASICFFKSATSASIAASSSRCCCCRASTASSRVRNCC